jgi:hypothetical protein
MRKIVHSGTVQLEHSRNLFVYVCACVNYIRTHILLITHGDAVLFEPRIHRARCKKQVKIHKFKKEYYVTDI